MDEGQVGDAIHLCWLGLSSGDEWHALLKPGYCLHDVLVTLDGGGEGATVKIRAEHFRLGHRHVGWPDRGNPIQVPDRTGGEVGDEQLEGASMTHRNVVETPLAAGSEDPHITKIVEELHLHRSGASGERDGEDQRLVDGHHG